LRALELRLLRCTLPSAEKPVAAGSVLYPELYSLLNDVVERVESGDYIAVLSSSPASTVLFSDVRVGSSDSARIFYTETLPECVTAFLNIDGDRDAVGVSYRALIVMALGIAALMAFTQCNIIGPVDNLSLVPLGELLIHDGEAGCSSSIKWEEWAHAELAAIGSDFSAKFRYLQYLIFAKSMLMRTKDVLHEGDFSSADGVRSISWWLARAFFLHQKLLDEHSSSLFDLLKVFMVECQGLKNYWQGSEDSSTILSMLYVEMGIIDLYYGRLDTFKEHLESAVKESNYDFFVSGALGFRTKHQVQPKAQLRLVAGSKVVDRNAPSKWVPVDDQIPVKTSETYEASDILILPQFVAEEGDSRNVSASKLEVVHQALLLAQCLALEKFARSDELQKWEMAPYIEAIDSQSSSPFMIRCSSDLLRIRWESSRSRTKQRALLLMENLVERLQKQPPGVAERLHYSFGVRMPPIPSLRKEYGDLLVSCGLIGEAMKIYEDLERWDDLIHCYKLLDKKPAAVELINRCLSQRPSDSTLWCSLGDVTCTDSCYEKALEVSGNRSSRALRSLARSAYNRGEYEKSTSLWESAMALNSLYPDGWFALGAAALKSRDVDRAIHGFSRAVEVDPENGEAWNNIACLHMMKKRAPQAVIAFEQAVKLKRNSWEMWENYSHVAADSGRFDLAMEAVENVLSITKSKRVDSGLLGKIMGEIESRDRTDDETERLLCRLGNILKRVVQSSSGNGEIWGVYGRWHKAKGDLVMCSEALQKQVRSYQGSDLWTDRNRFSKFAVASVELCKVYGEVGGREVFAAEMHLKSSIKQAVNFVDSEEYGRLVACLEDV
ncbi:hypothetical protein M569_04637, partial [Genlisea aurea]